MNSLRLVAFLVVLSSGLAHGQSPDAWAKLSSEKRADLTESAMRSYLRRGDPEERQRRMNEARIAVQDLAQSSPNKRIVAIVIIDNGADQSAVARLAKKYNFEASRIEIKVAGEEDELDVTHSIGMDGLLNSPGPFDRRLAKAIAVARNDLAEFEKSITGLGPRTSTATPLAFRPFLIYKMEVILTGADLGRLSVDKSIVLAILHSNSESTVAGYDTIKAMYEQTRNRRMSPND